MKLFRSVFVYGFAIFLNAAVSFVVFSVMTKHLTKEEFGIINLYSTFCLLLIPIMSMGVQVTLIVDFFKMPIERFRSYFTNGMFIPLALTGVFTILCLIFYYPLQHFLQLNAFFIITIPLACFLSLTYEIVLSIARNKDKYFIYAGYSIGKNLLDAGLTFLLILGFSMGWQGRLAGTLFGLVVTGIVIFFLVRRWGFLDNHVERKESLSIARTGMPFVPERLAIFGMGYSDRFIINYFFGRQGVGLYVSGAQIALVVNLIITTLNSAVYPLLFRELAHDQLNYKKIKNVVLGYIGLSGLVSLAIYIATPLIFKWFIGKEFQEGQTYTRLLILSSFVWSFYNIFSAFLLFLKKNTIVMGISLTGVILSVGLNFFLVPHFGIIGASYTSVIVCAVMSVLAVWFVSKNYDFRLLFGKRQALAETGNP